MGRFYKANHFKDKLLLFGFRLIYFFNSENSHNLMAAFKSNSRPANPSDSPFLGPNFNSLPMSDMIKFQLRAEASAKSSFSLGDNVSRYGENFTPCHSEMADYPLPTFSQLIAEHNAATKNEQKSPEEKTKISPRHRSRKSNASIGNKTVELDSFISEYSASKDQEPFSLSSSISSSPGNKLSLTVIEHEKYSDKFEDIKELIRELERIVNKAQQIREKKDESYFDNYKFKLNLKEAESGYFTFSENERMYITIAHSIIPKNYSENYIKKIIKENEKLKTELSQQIQCSTLPTDQSIDLNLSSRT